MKIKTAELIGPALNWAAAVADKRTILRTLCKDIVVRGRRDDGSEIPDDSYSFIPSEAWSQGGPIIENEKIALLPPNNHRGDSWKAFYYEPSQHDLQFDEAISYSHHGPTPLIAGMRCFVASKLGNEIEIPEELL